MALRRSGARTVLDLGCGEGPLLRRLAREPDFLHIVGLDQSAVALQRLRVALQKEPPAIHRKVELVRIPPTVSRPKWRLSRALPTAGSSVADHSARSSWTSRLSRPASHADPGEQGGGEAKGDEGTADGRH
ncbi:MAG: class I SAM-dependent methyltransferase [Reyranella sp.]|nr:class I SAM-dependent methyltransferase [Reyranella sp.]MDP1966438.1 class I SAM-dependent methyltransferase [Reyranella sp.]MDP2375845.1 class I SAM-dependent methyltransferase [Reyranella sp.]